MKTVLFTLVFALLTLSTNAADNSAFTPKNYSSFLGMPGFSELALKTHFKLYEGYVTNTNLLLKILKEYDTNGQTKTPQFAEIKRRLMWEYDGMRLHEEYFENLGGKGKTPAANDPLQKALSNEFGSFEAWKTDFVSTGAMRGIGWAVLYLDPLSGKLTNAWINEHDRGHLAGGNPLLIMDVFEHAYIIDYGLDRAKYIDAFFDNINWDIVSKRYNESQSKKA